MRIQINCPSCRSTYLAEVHQVVDVGQNPPLKQQLLSGQLNVAICPNCGMGGSIASPILYHDPAHELFMLYIPQELNMNPMQREQVIGQLTQELIKSLPMEQRKAYLFQPQNVLNMQNFMERVLETEGFTREMIDRQRKQSELLRTLAQADRDVVDYLVKQRKNEIDETFFAMLQQLIESVSQSNDEKQILSLLNLRAKLMTETPAGRRIEQQQVALHAFGREAKKSGGITAALLVKHILANRHNENVVDALVASGQEALNYEFFQMFTSEVETAQQAGDLAAAQHLTKLRERLLAIHDSLRQQSQQLMERANQTLQALLAAPDRRAAIHEHANEIDEFFMYFLSGTMTQAEKLGQKAQADMLNELHQLIVNEAENQMPPEILFLNELLEAETADQQQQLLAENRQMVSPTLLQMLEVVQQQTPNMDEPGLNGRIETLKKMIQAQL